MLEHLIQWQRRLTPLLFVFISLASCSSVGPYVEIEDPDAIPSGPGLFSGETGNISVSIGSDKDTESDQNLPLDESKELDQKALQARSEQIDQKIKQLEQEQKTIERLKQQR